jgi:hypothetical protein
MALMALICTCCRSLYMLAMSNRELFIHAKSMRTGGSVQSFLPYSVHKHIWCLLA